MAIHRCRPIDTVLLNLRVLLFWPVDGVCANFFPGPYGVFFDVDLRELVDQASVDGLAHLMRKLGTTLRRDVVIREEGAGGAPVLRYATASDQFSLI